MFSQDPNSIDGLVEQVTEVVRKSDYDAVRVFIQNLVIKASTDEVFVKSITEV